MTPELTVLLGSRGRPERVTVRTTDALAAPLEGVALADDAIACAERCHLIAVALMSDFGPGDGRVRALLNEAGRLSGRASAARDEFRRMAGLIEGPEPRAA